MKKKIFISHISDETAIAQWLKTRLERDFLGILDIFVSSDRSTIGAGTKWLEEVDVALRAADLQIVLCSAESVGRPWVNFEAGAVWLRGVPVVPACHSGLQPGALPVPLAMLQGLALHQAIGIAKLYDAIAKVAGVNTPAVDFDAVAREATELERDYELRRSDGLDLVEHPLVLCAASPQYAEPQYRFDLDLEVVQRHFAGNVTVERRLTSFRLMDLLTTQRFDIVHLVMAVDEETGDLVFDPVDVETRKPKPGADKMDARTLAKLLTESRTRLVVLATCKALLLAVHVHTVANMAASDQDIDGEVASAWADRFYRLLGQGKPVFKAFDLVRDTDSPIRAIRHKDVAFARTPSLPRRTP